MKNYKDDALHTFPVLETGDGGESYLNFHL